MKTWLIFGIGYIILAMVLGVAMALHRAHPHKEHCDAPLCLRNGHAHCDSPVWARTHP